MISGFGIYSLFDKMEKNNEKISFIKFIKKRLKNTLIPYYICIVIILLFTPGIAFFNTTGIKYVFESIFMIQNFDIHNSINGVTWTLATLTQLYIISIPLYKIIKKYGIKGYLFLLAVVIIIKKILFSLIFMNNLEPIYYTVASIRLPFTTFDLFAIGMLSSKFILSDRAKKINKVYMLLIPILLILYHFGFYLFAKYVGNIYQNRFISCCWQSLIGIYISVIIYFVSKIEIKWQSFIGKFIQYIACNEYGIYLWHMILLGNLLNFSVPFNNLKYHYPLIALVLAFIIITIIGSIYSILCKRIMINKTIN